MIGRDGTLGDVPGPGLELESGTRERTRRAILSAAASVLARDRSATLAHIASAARVGRSTLHRYFSDREQLVQAVIEDSLRVLAEASKAAALDQGPALEAMRRLVSAMVETGDRLLFLYGDPRVLADWQPGQPHAPEDEQAIVRLVARGQAEGVFDPDFSPEWVQHVIWALVYSGCEAVTNGTLPRHSVTPTVIRTLEHGIRAREPGRVV